MELKKCRRVVGGKLLKSSILELAGHCCTPAPAEDCILVACCTQAVGYIVEHQPMRGLGRRTQELILTYALLVEETI